jgi:rod shape-determining protein MreD
VRGLVAARVGLIVLALVVLQFTVRPFLGWRAPIDFLTIAALLAAVRVRPGAAAAIGLVLGLVADALTPSAFGSGALALTLVAYGASTLKAVFFADNAALSALFVFAGKWIFDILYLVSERRVRGAELLVQLLLWSPLAAAVTAVTALLLLVALRPAIGRATV